jgi:hypothetical protein
MVFLATIEYEDRRGDTRSEKEVCRQSDYRFEKVFLDGLLSYFSLAGSSEEDPMRDYHSDFSRSFVGGFYHVGDKRPIPLALWRHSPPKSVVFVACGIIRPPFVEGERRIRHYRIELHQGVSFFEFRIVQGVPPADRGVVESMKKHVHDGERPCVPVRLLSEKREIVGFHFFPGLYEERSGSASGIADTGTRLAFDELGKERGNLARGIELARFFSRVAREVRDEVFVRVPDDIGSLEMARSQVELFVAEVYEEIFEPGIPVFRLAQLVAVEVDVPEYGRPVLAAELFAVGFFKIDQGRIDELPDIGIVPVFEKGIERRIFRDDEPLVLHRILRAFGIPVVFFQMFVMLVPIYVAHVFDEQHREDVILVFARVDDPAKRAAGVPDDLVQFFLRNDGSHGTMSEKR